MNRAWARQPSECSVEALVPVAKATEVVRTTAVRYGEAEVRGVIKPLVSSAHAEIEREQRAIWLWEAEGFDGGTCDDARQGHHSAVRKDHRLGIHIDGL